MVDRVVSLMKEREITGVQLSNMLGLPKNTVAEWKRNSYKPSVETLSKLAELFEVSADYLLGRTDSKEPVNMPGKKKELPKSDLREASDAAWGWGIPVQCGQV